MSHPLARPVLAVLGAVLLASATYLGLTEGLERAGRSAAPVTAVGPGYLPEVVFDPSPTLRTTADFGPVGPVSLVFADDPVLGEPGTRWIAVSSQSGDYRALSAPHLPPAGRDALAVSPDGTRLAWAYDDGVVLYDTTTDRSRTVTDGLGTVRAVGGFSPDGRHLTAYDGRLHVVEVVDGTVAGTLAGLDERQARQATWTPDGPAVSYVDGGALVVRVWSGAELRRTAAPIAPEATLVWRAEGDQLAASRGTRYGRLVDVFEARADGLTRSASLRRDGYSMQRLLGYSGNDSVMLLGLSAETGPLPQFYELPTSGAPGGTDVASLPADAHVSATLQVAAGPLRNGSWAYPEPDWPVSDAAKLVASVLTGVFVLGLYVTRRRA